MVDFDPAQKATEIDEIAFGCLKHPRNEEIERRECAQKLYSAVAPLTQKEAVEVGKVFERYSSRNPPPHNPYLTHEILFANSTSPVVTGFKFTAADSYSSGYLSLTANVTPEQPRMGLRDPK